MLLKNICRLRELQVAKLKNSKVIFSVKILLWKLVTISDLFYEVGSFPHRWSSTSMYLSYVLGLWNHQSVFAEWDDLFYFINMLYFILWIFLIYKLTRFKFFNSKKRKAIFVAWIKVSCNKIFLGRMEYK